MKKPAGYFIYQLMIAATGKIVEVVVTQGFFYYLFMAAKKESYFCLFALDQHEVRHAGWCRRIRGLIFPPEGKQLPCFRRV